MLRIPKTELTPSQRGIIIGRRAAGETYSAIAAATYIPKSTIFETIKRAGERPGEKSLPRDHSRKTSLQTDRRLKRTALKERRQPLQELNANVAPEISRRTVQRRLQEYHIQKWLARKRPLLKQIHVNARYAWAKEHLHWTVEDWYKVIFSDECTIEKGSGKKPDWVFRMLHEALYKDCVNAKGTARAVVQMVWACFNGHTKDAIVPISGDPTSGRKGVTGEIYLDLLKSYLPDIITEDLIFMQDNASTHTYGPVKIWFAENGYTVMKWPPYSPDMNPIEHVWIELKKGIERMYPELATRGGAPKTVKPLIADAAVHSWECMSEQLLDNLVESMPRRVEALYEAKGWYTKY